MYIKGSSNRHICNSHIDIGIYTDTHINKSIRNAIISIIKFVIRKRNLQS